VSDRLSSPFVVKHVQEQDLHTKRTGHSEYADKTAESAKPIVLEKPIAGSSGTSDGADADKPAGVVH
jgi:hypothetical protein